MKLIFEDDNGTQFNIKLDTIKTEKLKKSDVIVASYEIGNANMRDAQIALDHLNSIIKNTFPDNKILTIATRGGVEDVSIKIIEGEKQ